MPARTGQDYLKGLEQEREIWLGGERIKDVTTHAGLRHGARAIAFLYDMQVDPRLRDEMTYISPTTGDHVGLSFIIPRTMDELERRRTMMLLGPDHVWHDGGGHERLLCCLGCRGGFLCPEPPRVRGQCAAVL